jgi:hypothetical protein
MRFDVSRTPQPEHEERRALLVTGTKLALMKERIL